MTGSRNSSGRTPRPARPAPRVAGARSRGRRADGSAFAADDPAADRAVTPDSATATVSTATGSRSGGVLTTGPTSEPMTGPATEPTEVAETDTGSVADTGSEQEPAAAQRRSSRRPLPRPAPFSRPRRVTGSVATATEGPAAAVPARSRRVAAAAKSTARTTVRSTAGFRRVAGRWWLVALLATGTVLATIIAGFLFVDWRHADARAEARRQVPSLAKTYAAKILSYDYRHIRQDADSASAVTVGDYRRQYKQSMDQLIIPQATGLKAVVRAEVLNAGVSEVSDDGRQAVVVVFANQTVTNTRIQGPRVDQVRVRLTMVRAGGSWRVSKVDSL